MIVTKENYEATVAELEILLEQSEALDDKIEELACAVCEYEEKEFPVG